MTAPRITVDLSKIRHNTRCLVDRLKPHGITVTGVTKAVCGHPEIANAMLEGGVTGLADARISNVVRMRNTGILCPITLIRTPMLSQVEQVVENCDDSFNTEMDIIAGLAIEARRKNVIHNIIVVVEMGDMREGILPEHLEGTVCQVLKTEGVSLKGIAANFACLGCVAPTPEAMTMLSSLAVDTERACGSILETVSGGGSANLPWALGKETAGQINNLRLGEAILLGTDPITGQPIKGLYTDAFKLLAEVIETKAIANPNPVQMTDPVLSMVCATIDRPSNTRSILAIGLQDTDAVGLTFPAGVTFIGATSDHIVVETTNSPLRAGDEMTLNMKYSALTRSMAAPDVAKVVRREKALPECIAAKQ
ncbi:alanine/ornithine racemase family PLP-dependent enzyme [Ruegeria sp. A3M17]|uniref:alanine/ornithine racemase family PLP-dependent enzyme n=1 Tax=Ruegeria sp. A3M17 TaxID=2267229 RepID=UPI000DEB9DED|nr:alanine/ornithine racemase family PLP-dependent enzyme [Ruegeria sp. A3M17]RBW60441.1 alanine/ornithine racemase family PLP-dependent enzyme [Ruegeria sp. A3M17]